MLFISHWVKWVREDIRMIIRQEESTPIGNYFHDNGILKLFDKIQEMVDEFEVDTDKLNSYRWL